MTLTHLNGASWTGASNATLVGGQPCAKCGAALRLSLEFHGTWSAYCTGCGTER